MILQMVSGATVDGGVGGEFEHVVLRDVWVVGDFRGRAVARPYRFDSISFKRRCR
jgi:hypothetical protein